MMNYQNFKLTIENMLLEYVPEHYKGCVIVNEQIQKTNGKMLDAFLLEGKDCPIFYIEQAYEQYLEGESIRNILGFYSKVFRNYIEAKDQLTDAIENMEESIFFVLINAEKNKKILSYAPHRIMGEFAIVYKANVNFGKEKATILITDGLAAVKELSEEKLYEIAYRNTLKLQEPMLFKMSIESMLNRNLRTNLLSIMNSVDENSMLVLTTEEYSEGASLILYKDLLTTICHILRTDGIYLLPSSRHEWIIVNAKHNFVDKLRDMVISVNLGEVDVEDFLSDNVYFYKKHSEGIVVC